MYKSKIINIARGNQNKIDVKILFKFELLAHFVSSLITLSLITPLNFFASVK
jgi:hypothetical protein